MNIDKLIIRSPITASININGFCLKEIIYLALKDCKEGSTTLERADYIESIILDVINGKRPS